MFIDDIEKLVERGEYKKALDTLSKISEDDRLEGGILRARVHRRISNWRRHKYN